MEQEQVIELNIGNINEGAIPQLFDHALREVLLDIADVNKPAEAVRTITIKLAFKPSPDRKIATVVNQVTTKIADVEPKAGTIFIASKQLGGKTVVNAFAEDPRQDRLFIRQPPASENRQ